MGEKNRRLQKNRWEKVALKEYIPRIEKYITS